MSENVFSLPVIYLHFSRCKFSLFLWIDWVRFKTRLAKGPIPELANWTAKSTKSKSLIYKLILWCFTCFFVRQCFVPTIAMYYSNMFGFNILKNMFLERKLKNASVWHTQYFKMGSFEVLKKSLQACPKWIKHECKRKKKKKIPCHTVALGIDLRRSPQE